MPIKGKYVTQEIKLNLYITNKSSVIVLIQLQYQKQYSLNVRNHFYSVFINYKTFCQRKLKLKFNLHGILPVNCKFQLLFYLNFNSKKKLKLENLKFSF